MLDDLGRVVGVALGLLVAVLLLLGGEGADEVAALQLLSLARAQEGEVGHAAASWLRGRGRLCGGWWRLDGGCGEVVRQLGRGGSWRHWRRRALDWSRWLVHVRLLKVVVVVINYERTKISMSVNKVITEQLTQEV